jgi:hypothetical protein
MPHQEESALSNQGLSSAEFELSSRLYLNFSKGTSPEQQKSWGKSTSCESYPQIHLWCFLLNFPRDHVSWEVKEEGAVERKGSFFMTRLFQPQFPGRGTIRKPILFPCQGNIRGVPYTPSNMPWHWPPYHSLSGSFFWSRDHRGHAVRIEWTKLISSRFMCTSYTHLLCFYEKLALYHQFHSTK